MPKYFNRQAAARDGTVFPSKKECNRYEELLILVRIGKITELKTQVPFEIIPKVDEQRAAFYIADFTYYDDANMFHVEDTKGFRTKEYMLKKKLMRWRHFIRIEEV